MNRWLKFLPNALTLLRMLLAPFVLWAAASGHWKTGIVLLMAAFLSDFLDGLAAKKLNAKTKLGGTLDRYADFILSGAGLIGLATAGLFPWWGVAVAPLIAIFLAHEQLFWPKHGTIHRLRPMISVSYLISAWIFILWVYLSQAFGWTWWYVLATLLILASAASLKRHRLRAWLRKSDA
jgi:phosphatidylserine synthase